MEMNPLSPERAAHIQNQMATFVLYRGEPCDACAHTVTSNKDAGERGLTQEQGWAYMTGHAGMFKPCADCQKPIDRSWIARIDPDAFRKFMDAQTGAFKIDDLRALPQKA
jgi:hypothetical protein